MPNSGSVLYSIQAAEQLYSVLGNVRVWPTPESLNSGRIESQNISGADSLTCFPSSCIRHLLEACNSMRESTWFYIMKKKGFN